MPRPNASRRGYGSKWQRARQAHLRREPWCRNCARHGRRTRATLVDHIVPHRGDFKKFWDRKNWASSCTSCHNGPKQSLERTGRVRGCEETSERGGEVIHTKAKRLPDSVEGEFPDGFDTRTICYWRDLRLVEHPPVGGKNGWLLYLPGGGVGNLSRHDVTEHEDGTITVSPSILVSNARGDRRRHGFLRRGVWEPCGDDVAPAVEVEP